MQCCCLSDSGWEWWSHGLPRATLDLPTDSHQRCECLQAFVRCCTGEERCEWHCYRKDQREAEEWGWWRALVRHHQTHLWRRRAGLTVVPCPLRCRSGGAERAWYVASAYSQCEVRLVRTLYARLLLAASFSPLPSFVFPLSLHHSCPVFIYLSHLVLSHPCASLNLFSLSSSYRSIECLWRCLWQSVCLLRVRVAVRVNALFLTAAVTDSSRPNTHTLQWMLLCERCLGRRATLFVLRVTHALVPRHLCSAIDMHVGTRLLQIFPLWKQINMILNQ